MKQSKFINVEDFEQDQYPVTFIIGARGVGKTVSALASKLRRCFNDHTRFIYLRRYMTEIETSSFNLDLLTKLVGHPVTRDFSTDENGRKTDFLLVDGEPVAYLLSLSTAAKYKSNDYSKVVEIVYDEFIDPRGRELKNETKLFLNFAMTVFRDFSKYHALFLANATNLYNCYFLDFEILPKNRITKFHNLGIKIVMYQTSDELAEMHQHSVLGRQVELLEGENGSSLHNKFENRYDDFLGKLSKKAKYIASLRLGGTNYGLYQDYDDLVLSLKYDPNYSDSYALTFDDAGDKWHVIDPRNIGNLVANFKRGSLRFTDVKTRSNWIRYFKHPFQALSD